MLRRRSQPLAAIILVLLLAPLILAQSKAILRGATAVPHKTSEAPVLKVFTVKEGDHRFVAYLIEWNGAEVIVEDTLGRSDFRVGDEIRFMVHRHKMTVEAGNIEPLNFILLEPDGRDAAIKRRKETPKSERERNERLARGDLAAAESEIERFYALGKAAKSAIGSGDALKANEYAVELAGLAKKHEKDWNYGNAIQDSNQVLGRLALAEGRVDEAKKRLLASADSEGSPQMNSFGPNMQLAKELLEKGETEVVLQYFERCRRFWEMGGDRLDAWAEAVQQGRAPDFGGNLRY